jgi:hypothetical protein
MSLSKYQQELLEKEIENCRLKVQLSEMETHLVKEQQQSQNRTTTSQNRIIENEIGAKEHRNSESATTV